ncbi:MAG TPA: glycosyltransferase, partial [Chloroflexota bacterium]|nr:glycosyltransferase [Chloroflexota bacterium]
TPGEEVLVASTPEDVAAYVREVSQEQAAGIGRRALRRVLRDHTYDRRGDQLQAFLPTLFAR